MADSQDPDFDLNPHDHSNEKSLIKRLWKYFLSGVLVTAPVGLTFYIMWIVVTSLDNMVKGVLPAQYYIQKFIPVDVPGFGIIIAFIVFTFVGAFAAGVMGRLLVRTGENLLNRMPFVRGLYSAVKQIFEAVFRREKNSFRQVVLVEYPRKGVWSLGFVTGTTLGEVQDHTKEEVLNVFVPTTPNPTSGYLLFVPRSDAKVLEMTVEEGIKMVVSAGIVTPEMPQKEKG